MGGGGEGIIEGDHLIWGLVAPCIGCTGQTFFGVNQMFEESERLLVTLVIFGGGGEQQWLTV